MPEKDTIFSTQTSYNGIFPFSEFYKFCYEWFKESEGFKVVEKKYSEKLAGDSKNVDIEWECVKNVSDYFQEQIEIKFRIIGLTKVEVIDKSGMKIKTNNGNVKLTVKGTMIKDYKGKFEESAFKKWMRGIYEKWIITARVGAIEDKITGDCNEFLAQAKAYLDLEGKT